MTTVVDSKETPLPAPTVVLTYASEANLPSDMDLQTALAMWVKEMTLPNVEMVQVGNTVFVGHRGKYKNKNKIMGRVFNVDTARNLVANTVKYFKVCSQKTFLFFYI